MSVLCANCGEELLGSVNRCWKCGRMLESRPGPSALPPVRRAPSAVATSDGPAATAANEVNEQAAETELDGAEGDAGADEEAVSLAASGDAGSAAACEDPGQAAPAGNAQPKGEAPQAAAATREEPVIMATAAGSRTPPKRMPGVVYHGSPFAPNAKRRAPAPTLAPAAAPHYPQNAAASGGAIASFCLGVMSFAVAAIFWSAPVVAIVLSLLGICMGIWGMYSNRRGFAAVGLFLCIGAFGWSGFMGVVQLYTMIHGVSPFAEPSEFDSEPLEP